jgi:predicted Zn-dependent protease
MSSKVETFRSLVAQDAANPLFRFSLGQALLQAGLAAEAVEHLQVAAASKADWMMPRILLGKAWLAQQQKERAREALQAALALAVAQGHEDPEAELRQLLAAL